jgi:8-oxo-dGTP pyrophosphatase MutT (NUDIX family)
VSEFRQQLISALDPLDGAPGRARFSDFDLNPDAPRQNLPLRPAAVLIPVVDHADGPTLLLTRRSDSLASHTGQIAFPGGRLDPGETVVQAALREAVEEVGLSFEHVEPLGLSDAYETVTGFLVTPVVAWVRPGFTLTTDPHEVADAFETPWDFLMDEANHRREFYDAPDGTRRWFWAMPWGERYIWGATAGMLRSLWGRLHDPAREDVA